MTYCKIGRVWEYSKPECCKNSGNCKRGQEWHLASTDNMFIDACQDIPCSSTANTNHETPQSGCKSFSNRVNLHSISFPSAWVMEHIQPVVSLSPVCTWFKCQFVVCLDYLSGRGWQIGLIPWTWSPFNRHPSSHLHWPVPNCLDAK